MDEESDDEKGALPMYHKPCYGEVLAVRTES